MYKATILILGGGVGGIVTANNLRKNCPKIIKLFLSKRTKNIPFSSVVSLVNG